MNIGVSTTLLRSQQADNRKANREDEARVANAGPLLNTDYSVEYIGDEYHIIHNGSVIKGLYFFTADSAVEYLRNAGRI